MTAHDHAAFTRTVRAMSAEWPRVPAQRERACAAEFETPEVVATCLLAPGHEGFHHDYGNGIFWGRVYPDAVGGE